MNTPFTRSATRSLRNAVGKAIVHISEQRARIAELETQVKHLEHVYSNAVYDLEQAEKLLRHIKNYD